MGDQGLSVNKRSAETPDATNRGRGYAPRLFPFPNFGGGVPAKRERGRPARKVALARVALILAFSHKGLAGVGLRLNSLYAP